VAKHGAVEVDGRYVPIHGCVSFAVDLESRPDYPGVCLAELARSVRYRCYTITSIEIQLVCVADRAYASDGRYYGSAPDAVYEIQCETACGDTYYHSLRAASRAQLRADLKRLYPSTKIGR